MTLRLVVLAGVLYLVVGVPSLLVGRAFTSHAAIAFLLGVVLFGSIQVTDGPRWCAGATLLGAVAVFLASRWGSDPVPVALVIGGTTFLAGFANRWARQSALLAVPMTAAVLSSPVTTSIATDRALGLVAGAAYGAVALTVLRLPAPTRAARLSARSSWLYGAILGAVVGLGTAVVIALDLPHGYWFALTVLAVVQPSISGSARKTFQRVVGTVVGSGVALVVAAVVPAHGAELALGLALVIASAVLFTDYRVRTALMTVGVVLLIEGNTPPETAVELRVGLTLAAALVVLGLCYLVPPLLRRGDPQGAPATVAT